MTNDLLQTAETVDTLQKFGPSFQSKVLSVLMTDKPFLERVYDIVTPRFFDTEATQWIAQQILTYFHQYQTLPTLEVFKIELNKEKDAARRQLVINTLREVYDSRVATDLTYVSDKFLDFCKNQSLKLAILKSVDMLEAGKYDNIKILVDKAMHAGAERNVGHDWKKDVDVRLSEMARLVIPTPWAPINKLLQGGLGGGELGVIAAPPGIGKSWLLAAIGATCLKQYNVLHYTLELNENYVGLRYDTIMTGIDAPNLKHNKVMVQNAIEKCQGNMMIKFFPTKSVTSHSLQAHVRQLEMFGFIPDIIIVDYADLLRSTERNEAYHRELGAVYEELRGIAGELDVPVWTASQTQRSSTNLDVIEADKIAESFSKIMIADFVMSLSRKADDKVNNTARIHLIKNRFGPDGITLPVYMNTQTGSIDVYESNSEEGAKIADQRVQGKLELQKTLLNRFQDIG